MINNTEDLKNLIIKEWSNIYMNHMFPRFKVDTWGKADIEEEEKICLEIKKDIDMSEFYFREDCQVDYNFKKVDLTFLFVGDKIIVDKDGTNTLTEKQIMFDFIFNWYMCKCMRIDILQNKTKVNLFKDLYYASYLNTLTLFFSGLPKECVQKFKIKNNISGYIDKTNTENILDSIYKEIIKKPVVKELITKPIKVEDAEKIIIEYNTFLIRTIISHLNNDEYSFDITKYLKSIKDPEVTNGYDYVLIKGKHYSNFMLCCESQNYKHYEHIYMFFALLNLEKEFQATFDKDGSYISNRKGKVRDINKSIEF